MPGSDTTAALTARHTLVLVALYLVVPAVIIRPLVDLDIWWHLRAGHWIVQHGQLPVSDPFSAYGAGRRWVAYHWLFDAGVHAAHEAAGLVGIVGFTLALGFAITLALHRLARRLQPDLFVSSLLVALTLLAMATLLVQPRPWLVSILLFVLQLTILLDVRRTGDPRPLFGLPLLYVVWANVNIQFVYGLFVLGLAALEPLLQRARIARDGEGRLPLAPVLLALGGSLVATVVGPYHVLVYLPVIEHALFNDPFLYIAETQAPRFRGVFDWGALALLLAAVLLVGRQRRPSPFLVALLITGAVLFFRSSRDVWMCAVASFAVVSTYLPSAEVSRVRLGAGRVTIIAATAVAVSLLLGAGRLSAGRVDDVIAARFPVEAAAFVERHGLEGPLYNDLDWGGYLIWRLPGLPVSMDGRTALHGDERILRSMATWSGARGWDTDEELIGARLVIGPSGAALTSLLRLDPRFALVYEDEVAAVFVRREGQAVAK